MHKPFVSPWLVLAGSIVLAPSCARKEHDIQGALASITAQDLIEDVKTLSSDEFEGRAPSSPGEEKTVRFLATELEKIGVSPGNGGSFFQEVPLVEITANPAAQLTVTGGKTPLTFAFGDDFLGWTLRVKEKVALEESEMVFVGYGVVAPEYDWNDYKGADVKGKTVVMLVNDPGFGTGDPNLFNGRAMTYYGRWTYKFEEAARQGAAGALLIHEDEPATYGWDVVRNSWSGPRFSLVTQDDNASRCVLESWISLETTKKIFEAAGLTFEAMKSAALDRSFEARPLGLKASVTLESAIRKSVSRNVVGVLPGSERADEFVIYTAHWDHFGKDPKLEGDQIFNGALDNATGLAGLLELAEAFKKLPPPTGRSILFLSVTAEEQGLLGSDYYATHPIYPLTKTAAVINMDSANIFGRMKDVRVVGHGQSELDDYLEEAAREQDRVVLPDATPEKGSFYRSDHFPFAKQGVPALNAGAGVQHREKGEEWGRAQKEEHSKKHYHKVSDEYDPNWDLSGAIEDLQLFFKVGYRLSMESRFPNWKEGSEFKAKRDADLGLR